MTYSRGCKELFHPKEYFSFVHHWRFCFNNFIKVCSLTKWGRKELTFSGFQVGIWLFFSFMHIFIYDICPLQISFAHDKVWKNYAFSKNLPHYIEEKNFTLERFLTQCAY